ncbi:MAG: serpin family protein [Faecousia sp.]
MKHEKLSEALSEISDQHIAEAANAGKKRRPYWIGTVAAALSLVILAVALMNPLAVRAEAVSVANYPKYEWKSYRDEMLDAKALLTSFFGASITKTLSGTDGENQTYSPINLYMALSLTAELTGGDSRQQILDLLSADSLESLRTQANSIWNACYRDDGDQTLLANSLWLDDSLSYHQSVMDTLADSYYTSVYRGELGSKKTNQAIQTWLNRQTGGLLKKEVQNAGVPTDTSTFPVLMLYSTVYYQAKWQENVEFSAENNTAGKFHAPGGDVACTFMNKKELQTFYYWGEDYGAVSLGLKDGSQMWLILPDADKTLNDVLSSGEYLEQVLAVPASEEAEPTSKYMKVNLSLPKFDITAQNDLKADMQALGVTDIFDAGAADFSPSVDGDYPVWLTAMNQATRVAIDEEGVTAASYIELPGAGAAQPPEEIIDFVLDRPFLFVITNRYHLPLFAGVVNQPQ